jgi:hypothetical protein
MSASAGQSVLALAVDAGGPCTPQLDPEHWLVWIEPGLSAFPPPQASKKGALAMAHASPLEMAYMLLSPCWPELRL